MITVKSSVPAFPWRRRPLNQGPDSSTMRRLAIILALAPLVACVGGAGHRAPDLTLPPAYEAPTVAGALTPQALDRWWLLFGDAHLNGLEDEAFRLAPDARTEEARVLEARATRNGQTAQTLPSGQIQANASREHAYNIGSANNSLFPIGGVTDSLTANFDISWELDLFGRLREARRVANASLAQARFNIEGARASLAASIADNYFQAKGFIIQLADARESVRIDASLLRIAQIKATVGLGATSDADRIAGDLAQARAQAQDLESQLHAAQRQLLILVGAGAAPVESLAMRAELLPAPRPPPALPGDLLIRRPDVREAEARLRVQAGTGKLRHLALFPTFTLLPQLGASSITSPGVAFIPPSTLIPAQQSTSVGFWSLGAGVTVPVLNIPQLLYEARAEDARTEQAVIAYEKTVQTAYGEAENALVNLDAGERAVATLTDGEARARRASDAAARLYAMGLGDLTTALTAEQSWRATRAALTSEKVQA
ncbi:MAG: TolC family protein, partial [Caulobacteraceae bacterium]